MKLPCRYKAKGIADGRDYTGYYVKYPATTYCFESDGIPRMKHCLVYHQMTDWGLPNNLVVTEIDPDTLEPLEEGETEHESEKV